jgi:hypothetical protein
LSSGEEGKEMKSYFSEGHSNWMNSDKQVDILNSVIQCTVGTVQVRNDVTLRVMGTRKPDATAANVVKALQWIDQVEWGFVRAI